MSVSLDEYSAVVGQVYEASLDVSAWEPTLEATCRFVGASKGALATHSTGERVYDVQVHVGYEPHWIDVLHRKYAAINPLGGSQATREVGEVYGLSSLGLIGAFDGDPMYEEWVKPQGILDVSEVVLDRSMGFAGTVSYTRLESEGVFTPDSFERIRLLFPHLRRSVLISRVLRMHRRGEDELAEVVENLAAGAFMLSASGEVLRCNAAGERLLASRTLSAPRGSRLKFADPPADRAFVEALRGAARGSLELGGKGVSIPLGHPGEGGHVAHLLPLSAAAAEDDLHTRGAAMAVFVSPANRNLMRSLEVLARTYGLTVAERRVALALAEIGAPPIIADALGVSVTTVRTHLRSLYQKTGARRQTEIVNLLRGLVSPFG